jgi:probable addiction module antidote protein
MSKVGRTLQLKKSLNVAFATNDLHRVCGAIDAAVLKSPTIIKVAQDAGVNRTTLYRAFRCQRGPTLSTMIKVLRVLGFQLVVQANRQRGRRPTRLRPIYERNSDKKATARLLTVAFGSCDLNLVVKALAETLHAQENIARLARKTIRARESGAGAHSNLEIIIVASPGSFFLFGPCCYEFRANLFAVFVLREALGRVSQPHTLPQNDRAFLWRFVADCFLVGTFETC